MPDMKIFDMKIFHVMVTRLWWKSFKQLNFVSSACARVRSYGFFLGIFLLYSSHRMPKAFQTLNCIDLKLQI